MDRSSEGRERFIAEGLRSYLKALLAVRAFQQEVQSVALEVLQGCKAEIEKALGVEIDEGNIEPYGPQELNNPKWSGSDAWLGAWLQSKDMPFKLHVGLWWSRRDLKEGEIRASVHIELYAKRMLDKLVNTFRSAGPRRHLSAFEGGAEFYQDLQSSDLAECRVKLGELLDEWVCVWEKCGGLKRIMKRVKET